MTVFALAQILFGACAASAQQQPLLDPDAAPITISGIPSDKPMLVTVIPFAHTGNEAEEAARLIPVHARVDSIFGLFLFDMGAPSLNLNRTFIQPSPTGGVDTVRAGDGASAPATVARVTLHLGTLSIVPVDSKLPGSGSRIPNAFLNHKWDNYTTEHSDGRPLLGNIGLTVLEPFETIIDYTHRRLVLIQLDSAGHRMVDVPAYKPRRTVPLLDLSSRSDTTHIWWGVHVTPEKTLDTLNAANNTEAMIIDSGAAYNVVWLGLPLLGYPFLSQFGAVGFNHRLHQLILYQ